MLDWVYLFDYNKKVTYVFFDTGLEYEATKRHLDYLEQKYGIEIKRIRAIKPIPTCCKEIGVPFLSKHVSEMINRAQKHGFEWKDESYETLIEKYPNAIGVCKWWCNKYGTPNYKAKSSFNINSVSYLKEFLIANPPKIKISKACCKYAKKDVSAKEMKNGYNLSCVGVRQEEGGIRSVSLKSCFTSNENKSYDDFRPLFFLSDKQKAYYKKRNNILYSDCYEIWGFTRTGCAGCPYNSKAEQELAIARKYEPKFYKACMSIFGESYEYRRQYVEFKDKCKAEEKVKKKKGN